MEILANAPLAQVVAQTQEFGPERDQAMAGPFGLFVTVFLVVVTVLLVRGMNKHVRRLNERVAREAAEARAADGGQDDPARA
ncbi:hypothetical protein K3N28_21980 [Glycomyces sp. TRM65418]|nr:hypothetical protein [Glycomyces sp. TRM65418]MCC3765732.1 hypothetical protein [Glycomyces sp. TRM65418]